MPKIPKQVTQAKKPITQKPNKKYWVFSFSYWQQITNFGLGQEGPSWFLSLFERLKILSKEYIDDVFHDYSKREAYRLHVIDWSDEHTTIKKDDFKTLPQQYLGTDFYTFSISLANGRVVGFFDDDSVFNIVLLDPKHNAVLSSYSNYKIRDTIPAFTEYDYLFETVNTAREIAKRCNTRCDALSALDGKHSCNYIPIEEPLYSMIEELMKLHSHKSVESLLSDSLLVYSEKNK